MPERSTPVTLTLEKVVGRRVLETPNTEPVVRRALQVVEAAANQTLADLVQRETTPVLKPRVNIPVRPNTPTEELAVILCSFRPLLERLGILVDVSKGAETKSDPLQFSAQEWQGLMSSIFSAPLPEANGWSPARAYLHKNHSEKKPNLIINLRDGDRARLVPDEDQTAEEYFLSESFRAYATGYAGRNIQESVDVKVVGKTLTPNYTYPMAADPLLLNRDLTHCIDVADNPKLRRALLTSDLERQDLSGLTPREALLKIQELEKTGAEGIAAILKYEGRQENQLFTNFHPSSPSIKDLHVRGGGDLVFDAKNYDTEAITKITTVLIFGPAAAAQS